MPRQGIAPAPQRIAASTCSPCSRGRRRLQTSFRRVPGLRLLETGLQAIQLSPYRADPPAHRPVRLGTVTGFLACYFPLSPFGSRVSHQIQRHLLQSLPATRAIQQCASWRTQVPCLLHDPRLDRVLGGAEDPDAAGAMLDRGQDVDFRAVEEIGGEKSSARIPCACDRRNSGQPELSRRGDGSIPALLRICHTVDAATVMPSPAIRPEGRTELERLRAGPML